MANRRSFLGGLLAAPIAVKAGIAAKPIAAPVAAPLAAAEITGDELALEVWDRAFFNEYIRENQFKKYMP